jgi:hypothetical protein
MDKTMQLSTIPGVLIKRFWEDQDYWDQNFSVAYSYDPDGGIELEDDKGEFKLYVNAHYDLRDFGVIKDAGTVPLSDVFLDWYTTQPNNHMYSVPDIIEYLTMFEYLGHLSIPDWVEIMSNLG